MIVIAVGPDKVGKSTLTAEVAKRMYPDVIYKGKPRSDAQMTDASKHIIEMAQQRLFVWCDRFHFPDDTLYREALDLEPQSPGLQMYMAMCGKLLRDMNAIFLFLDATDEDLIHRYHTTEEDPYVSPERLLRVAHLYRNRSTKMEERGFHVIRMNTSVLSMTSLHENVIQTLSFLQAQELQERTKHD